MIIKNNKLYENRTYKYLFPVVKYYGEELTNYLNYFIKLGVGLNDDNKRLPGGCLCILISTNPKVSNLEDYLEKLDRFLTWIKYQDYYITDYVYSMSEECSSHMVVIDIPMAYNTAYIKFILGRYSQMYTVQQVEFLYPLDKKFRNDDLKSAYLHRICAIRNVLYKNDEKPFLDKVNKEFNTNIKKFEVKNELDFPIDLKEEYFNYKDK